MEKYIVQIPVKKKSERIDEKNVRPFLDTCLVEIAIRKALNVFDKSQIYLNTNCEKSIEYAEKYNINVYKRDIRLANNDTTLDTFTYDFIKKSPTSSYTVLVNTVSPLFTEQSMRKMLDYFESCKVPSLISGNVSYLHSFINNQSINFDNNGSITQTQNNIGVQTCNWGMCIWDSSKFISNYEEDERAVFCDHFELFNTPRLDSIKINNMDDFLFAEQLYKLNRPAK